jgi:hypothetical protein
MKTELYSYLRDTTLGQRETSTESIYRAQQWSGIAESKSPELSGWQKRPQEEIAAGSPILGVPAEQASDPCRHQTELARKCRAQHRQNRQHSVGENLQDKGTVPRDLAGRSAR